MADLIGKSLGRYQILEQLGEGGMATVFKARDPGPRSLVAVKVIRTELLPRQLEDQLLRRFRIEATAQANLTHPNIVKVMDFGEDEGRPYLVMPYLGGGTLRDRLAGQPIPWREAVRFLTPIAKALQYAHQHNILHRDVKPSNILTTESGEPMLADFGVAKMLTEETQTSDLTGTGLTVGTAAYMAPEQAAGRPVDRRADIYSFGVVLFEMITGRKPYMAGTPVDLAIKQATESLPRPSQFVPDLPDSVERLLLKALAKNRDDRFPDMAAMVRAMQSLREDGPARAAPPPQPGQVRATPLNDISETSGTRVLPTPVPRWGLIAAAGMIALIAVVAGAIAMLRADPGEPVPASVENQAAVGPEQAAAPVNAVNTSTAAPELPPATPTLRSDARINSVDGAEIIPIPAGEFTMGSDSFEKYFWGAEAPRHAVYVYAFWIYRTEVTNKMYRACVDADACPMPEQFVSRTHGDYFTASKYDNYPVIYVDHTDALAYCQWAGGRLPTEAEWEKAARGNDGRMFPWGDDDLTGDLANFCDVGCPNPEQGEIEGVFNDGYRDLAPVASFPAGASPYGIYDMAGNALEWVADWMGAGYYSQTPYENPEGPASGSKRVIRGGSWLSGRAGLRAAARASLNPKDTYDTVGFRCAISTPP